MEVFSIVNLPNLEVGYNQLKAFYELSRKVSPILKVAYVGEEKRFITAISYKELAKDLGLEDSEAIDLLTNALTLLSELIEATDSKVLGKDDKDIMFLLAFNKEKAQAFYYFEDEKLLEALKVGGFEMFTLITHLLENGGAYTFPIKEVYDWLKIKPSYQVQFCILRDRFIDQFNKRMKGGIKLNVERIYRGVIKVSVK